MLDIKNVTNLEIEESNSNESSSNKRIKKICVSGFYQFDLFYKVRD
jgi:hypothetical protein